MTSPLAEDIAWLNSRLDEVISGSPSESVAQLHAIAERMLESGQLATELAELNYEEIHAVLKLLTIRFHLRNKAEQVHIARVNRNRERVATAETPRSESLAEAIGLLAKRNVALEQVQKVLAQLDIRPTLTAHPTESRRRSVIQKQARVADLLHIKNAEGATPEESTRAEGAMRQTLSLLLATDEVRARRLEVIDEVRNGVHYLAGAIWDAVPELYRDLTTAIETYYGQQPDLPAFLRYRSWIGGDRDGNPNVTAALTESAFGEMRTAAIARHTEALESLRLELSVSNRRVPIDERLTDSIRRDEEEQPLDPYFVRHLAREPFRVKIRHMQMRLGQPEYSSQRFLSDLLVLQRALVHAGLNEVARNGPLADAIIRAKTFGFHLAALDIRQDSRVHEVVVAELLRTAGVETDYLALDETSRSRVLRQELQTGRPLLPRGVELSAESAPLLKTLEVIFATVTKEPESVGSYIISMAHQPSDVLEVLILFREAGLWTNANGEVSCPLDIAPLFETVDDLDGAASVMQELFADPIYAKQLQARGGFQEIMLGYSDSNKDGGYWAANWRLQNAQSELSEVCRAAGVRFRFFHGRGGTVARGGGRAHRAILASPPASRNGQIRFTEQGEVISFRYAMPTLAHRHVEQIANAMILATAEAKNASAAEGEQELAELMNLLAGHSRRAYRQLIDDAKFWPAFLECSPVLHIGELPIASRPVSRSGGEIRFQNLRAIPWVFAWTQMRFNAPGWYGIGSAFSSEVNGKPEALNLCQSAYKAGGYFRAFIDNAQQEMARARLPVARWYLDQEHAELYEAVAEEFELAKAAILAITDQEELLDNNRVIQQSIRERNPDTDIINALQVELLRRWRQAGESESGELRSLILLSVNALAAAMQSTG